MHALSDERRRALVRTSWLLGAGALAVTPFLASSGAGALAAAETAPRVLRIPNVPARLAYPRIVVARDPFVADAAAQASFATGIASGGSSSTATVRAVVLGAAPRALVERDGAVRVVGVGDAFAGSTVTSIDASGVTLADGVRVTLEQGAR